MSTNTQNFKAFIQHLEGSTEVGAVIAKNSQTKDNLLEGLKKDQFAVVTNITTLPLTVTHHHRVAIDPASMGEAARKTLYDFICQYPTGSIQVDNFHDFDSKLIKRSLAEHRTIIVVDEKELSELEKQFPILESVGMVWRESVMETTV